MYLFLPVYKFPIPIWRNNIFNFLFLQSIYIIQLSVHILNSKPEFISHIPQMVRENVRMTNRDAKCVGDADINVIFSFEFGMRFSHTHSIRSHHVMHRYVSSGHSI